MAEKVQIEHHPKHGGGAPPWITWGNTKVLRVTGVPLVASISAYEQLVDVKYHRPESWRFFFAAKVLGISAPPLPVSVTVEYQVTWGNGFATFQADFFQVLEFAVGQSAPGSVRMCTSVEQHAPNTASTAPNLIEVIPAQNLYVAARLVTLGSINAGNQLTMQVTAFASPNVHVRPGWHLENFVGKEEA